jgi:hypothetical protein
MVHTGSITLGWGVHGEHQMAIAVRSSKDSALGSPVYPLMVPVQKWQKCVDLNPEAGQVDFSCAWIMVHAGSITLGWGLHGEHQMAIAVRSRSLTAWQMS